jgi:hypothetical protein
MVLAAQVRTTTGTSPQLWHCQVVWTVIGIQPSNHTILNMSNQQASTPAVMSRAADSHELLKTSIWWRNWRFVFSQRHDSSKNKNCSEIDLDLYRNASRQFSSPGNASPFPARMTSPFYNQGCCSMTRSTQIIPNILLQT